MSAEESCLPLPRRVRPAVAKVGAEAGGTLLRMESVKYTAADVEETTGQMDDHASKWLYALSGRGLPNTSSMSVDQLTKSFDVSESWRNEVLLNELKACRILGSRGRHRVTEPRVWISGAIGIDFTYWRRVE